jgi:hypothetical protein
VRDELVEMCAAHPPSRRRAEAGCTDWALHGYTGPRVRGCVRGRDVETVPRLRSINGSRPNRAPPAAYDTSEMVADMDAFVAALACHDSSARLSMGGLV